ncbi:MAG TPA: chemotaxis-specific protein-glutamate methyltransferase CheB [Vicinamibacterales bacterium]|nr:chemotaxis-specific protein-glutamate methyltransferase CheB [Vicinamibacterales bacterium]
MPELVRVLVVDDSAYVRKVVAQMLERSPFIEVVGTARDGQEALDLVAQLHPDVVTCDLNMPVMDGVAFVQEQMKRQPVPIVIISIAAESGEQVLAALDAGAIDFVQKPTALATEKLMDIAEELVEKVKAAALAPRRALAPPPVERRRTPRRATRGAFDIVVIGISTGGPQALKILIPELPGDCPVPIAMVLHMPLGYTEMYARKLDEMSDLHVVEAKGGEEVVPGMAFLAPAGRHLTFRSGGARVVTQLDIKPLDTPHRPSVDVLFHSAADVYGPRVLGVVMTGMGSDGREGAAWIKARGGSILTESEDSCVVYGMPRSVVEAGLSDDTVPLERLARAIMEKI